MLHSQAHIIQQHTNQHMQFTYYLLPNLLTPWCRVLLEKLTGLQLVKKFPAFHGTRRFVTALTGVRHLSLSWASPIQSIYPHPTSWRSIYAQVSPVVYFPPVSPARPYTPRLHIYDVKNKVLKVLNIGSHKAKIVNKIDNVVLTCFWIKFTLFMITCIETSSNEVSNAK